MTNNTLTQTQRIAELSDLCRRARGIGDQWLITPGISALPQTEQAVICERVMCFADFTPDNDPYGERDLGGFTHHGHKVFWKIDCYAPDMVHGSEGPPTRSRPPLPAAPAITGAVFFAIASATGIIRPMTEDYISASEIGEYLYCRRAWWYRRRGTHSTNQPVMETGARQHDQLAQTEHHHSMAWRMLLAAAILLIVILVLRGLAG